MPNKSRLIVVSNRLPVRLQKSGPTEWEVMPSAGGLVTSLTPVLNRRGGVWVGWPGTMVRSTISVEARLKSCTNWSFRLVPVFLDQQEVRNFYRGFANGVIWPLFHDCFNLCDFDPRYWEAYKSANMKFAQKVIEDLDPTDIIWVHDYQLMNVGQQLRKLGVRNKIGFFNHIPFPTPDIFRRLPWRESILNSLLRYDLIGLQLARDQRHFFECLEDVLGSGQLERRPTVRSGEGSSPRIGHFPISIDFEEFAKTAASKPVTALAKRLKAQSQGRQLLLGIDRLDYSKGLLEKLSAFRYALEKYSELRRSIMLVQYVVPSRVKVPEYRTLRLRIERMVGEINGAFSEPGWIPIHYYFQSLERKELCAHYRAAEICLVTSIKDGMNLICKEYCVAQVDEPGVLILSESAGAAAELKEGALVVNPFDVEKVADAIYRAFAMTHKERAQRMRRLRDHIRTYDVYHWVDSYLSALASAPSREDSLDQLAAV